jgi:hypothetical protein
VGILIVTDQDDGSEAIEARIAHLAGQLGSVRERHLEIQEHDFELALAENTGRLSAFGQNQGLDTDGTQDFLNQFTGCGFVVDDESSFLHVGGRFLMFATSAD